MNTGGFMELRSSARGAQFPPVELDCDREQCSVPAVGTATNHSNQLLPLAASHAGSVANLAAAAFARTFS